MADRRVTLVLCTPDGELLGALPPFDVPMPWWQHVDDVVAGAKAVHGIDVRVLRLLTCQAPRYPGGGPVSYLAEVDAAPRVDLQPWPGKDPLADEPLRLPHARPGGHRADLSWARGVLHEKGIVIIGAPEQIRTWNLSSIWRLPTSIGPVWLKVVPPFFAAEGIVLPLLDPAVVPTVLGAEPGRVLLGEVPGDDQYDATGESLLEMVRMLVRLQVDWIDRTAELLALGVPDLRPEGADPADPGRGGASSGGAERGGAGSDRRVGRRAAKAIRRDRGVRDTGYVGARRLSPRECPR
jgi:hypothetical protein